MWDRTTRDPGAGGATAYAVGEDAAGRSGCAEAEGGGRFYAVLALSAAIGLR